MRPVAYWRFDENNAADQATATERGGQVSTAPTPRERRHHHPRDTPRHSQCHGPRVVTLSNRVAGVRSVAYVRVPFALEIEPGQRPLVLGNLD